MMKYKNMRVALYLFVKTITFSVNNMLNDRVTIYIEDEFLI